MEPVSTPYKLPAPRLLGTGAVQTKRHALPELRAALAADAEAHGEDGVNVVVLDPSRNLAFPLGSNHPEFPDGWTQPPCLVQL